MAKIIDISLFTQFTLSDLEELQGGLLTITQKQVIQNDRAHVVQQIMNLVFDPLKPQDFAQQDAYMKAQLSTFTFMLDRSEDCEKRFNQINSQPSEN